MNQPATDAPRLLLDEQIWFGLAPKLRSEGFDVIHAIEVGLAGTSDQAILSYATKEGRTVLTFNVRDFVVLFSNGIDKQDTFGIVVSDQIPRGELHRRVTNLLTTKSVKQLQNSLVYLQDFK